VNKELGTNENKAVVVTYEVLSWYIPGVTEENNENILKIMRSRNVDECSI